MPDVAEKYSKENIFFTTYKIDGYVHNGISLIQGLHMNKIGVFVFNIKITVFLLNAECILGTYTKLTYFSIFVCLSVCSG